MPISRTFFGIMARIDLKISDNGAASDSLGYIFVKSVHDY